MKNTSVVNQSLFLAWSGAWHDHPVMWTEETALKNLHSAEIAMTTHIYPTPKPIAWWFTRGAASVITIPVFLVLVVGTIGAFLQGGIQTLAYLKVTKAVWGWFGFAAFFFTWPFLLVMPGFLWWSAIRETPNIYLQEAATASKGIGIRQAVITVILLIAFSTFVQWGHGKIIGWIADREHPCAAYCLEVSSSRATTIRSNHSGIAPSEFPRPQMRVRRPSSGCFKHPQDCASDIVQEIGTIERGLQ
jgi:hypothetical protein